MGVERAVTYDTNDSAIVVSDLCVSSLDEGEGGEEEGDPTKEPEAKGHCAA